MIYLNEGFNGLEGLYANDIAVIVLKNRVPFTNDLEPVCIDWNSIYKVKNKDKGKVNNKYVVLYYSTYVVLKKLS